MQPKDPKTHNEYIVKTLSENPDMRFNKEWRMNNLYWITTKDGTRDVFNMNRAQKHFFDNYLNIKSPYYRHCILKSRQLGFTTFIDIFILDEILFNPNKEGMVIAHKVQDAKEIFDRKIDFAIKNFNKDLQGALFRLARNSAKKIQVQFTDVVGEGSTSNIAVDISGRSATLHYLHISEFAEMCIMFPQRANELEQATFPAVPFDGMIFIESTAKTMSGRFYEIFNAEWMKRDAITPTLSRVKFLPHFYNWTWDDMEMKKISENIPTTDMEVCEINWEEYKQEHNLNDKEITYYYMKYLQLGRNVHKLRQEYPTTAEEAFVNTGSTFFPTTRIVSDLANAQDGITGELIPDEKGNLEFMQVHGGVLEVFEKPLPNTRYVIGGDTAEGLAHGDYQVLFVINAKTEKCAAVYRSKVPPDEFAVDAFKVGKYYNWGLLGVESNKDGLWVNDSLDKMGYTNLYFRKVFDDITKTQQKYFGWKTTSATRPFALASLRALYMRTSNGFPKVWLHEALKFVRNAKGKAEAMLGEHDDVIMSSSIAAAILQETGKQGEEMQKKEIGLLAVLFGEGQ